MRVYTLTIVLIIGLVGCVRTNNEKPKTTEVPIQDLELNEIIHDSLTTEQINDITRIQKVFSEVNSTSLVETINNFKRDQHPGDEIAIWLKMADAYERFTLRADKAIGHNEKNEAYELILLRSMMTEEEVLAKSTPKFLTKDEAKEVLSYYVDLPQPLNLIPL